MSKKDNLLKLHANGSTEMRIRPFLGGGGGGGWVPLGILGGCVPPGSPSPEPISYETM